MDWKRFRKAGIITLLIFGLIAGLYYLSTLIPAAVPILVLIIFVWVVIYFMLEFI